MSADDRAKNPLAGLEIGSCAYGATGKFGPSVIRGKITRTVVQPQEWKSMRGQSSYVYQKRMNQGSIGISGSYGVSGVSKLNGSLSAYVGYARADSEKSTTINYEVLVCGGVEHINFDDLTPSELLAALANRPKELIGEALDAYKKLNDSLSRNNRELFDIVSEPSTYKDEYALFESWLKAADRLKKDYGDGMVVAVAWGGAGVVKMEIKSKSGETSWKYGGEGELSYAGTGGSFSVGATYDGGQSQGKADVKVECTSFASGSCVKAQTDEWFLKVSGKSFDQLADVKVLDQAPDMTIAAKVKSPPEFVKPKEDELVQAFTNLKNIRDLTSNKSFAEARSYLQEKKKNPKLTPSEFLEKAEQKAEGEDLRKLAGTSPRGSLIPWLPKLNKPS